MIVFIVAVVVNVIVVVYFHWNEKKATVFIALLSEWLWKNVCFAQTTATKTKHIYTSIAIASVMGSVEKIIK